MYAFVCIFLYIPGGILADKVSSKKAIILSLLGTAAVTVIFMLTFSYPVALGVWFRSRSAGRVLVSDPQAVRMIGTEQEQGFMYGVLRRERRRRRRSPTRSR
ncbi:MAG: hypothetical protein ACLT4Y_07785 [Bifidobacterium breve]